MKELLLKYIVSKARECTTFSMNTGPNFDPWNLKSADFFVYSLHFENHFGPHEKTNFCGPTLYTSILFLLITAKIQENH